MKKLLFFVMLLSSVRAFGGDFPEVPLRTRAIAHLNSEKAKVVEYQSNALNNQKVALDSMARQRANGAYDPARHRMDSSDVIYYGKLYLGLKNELTDFDNVIRFLSEPDTAREHLSEALELRAVNWHDLDKRVAPMELTLDQATRNYYSAAAAH